MCGGGDGDGNWSVSVFQLLNFTEHTDANCQTVLSRSYVYVAQTYTVWPHVVWCGFSPTSEWELFMLKNIDPTVLGHFEFILGWSGIPPCQHTVILHTLKPHSWTKKKSVWTRNLSIFCFIWTHIQRNPNSFIPALTCCWAPPHTCHIQYSQSC